MTRYCRDSFALPRSRGGRLAGRAVATLAVAAVLAGAPAAVQAQGAYFPNEAPVLFFVDDFEDPYTLSDNWTGEGTHTTELGDWTGSVGCATSAIWGVQSLRETASDASGAPGVWLVNTSLPEAPVFDGYGWSNFKLEVDFSLSSAAARVGFVWAASADLLGAGNGRDDGYLVVVESPQTAAAATAGGRARWRLYKRTSDFTQQIATDLVELPGGAGLTVLQGSCYRLRLEWFCGNLQVSIRRFAYDASCPGGCHYGCSDPGNPCTASGDPELCWCPFIRWTDPAPLPAGAGGIFTGGTGAAQATYLDNFTAATWGPGCVNVCTAWSPYSESWAAAGNARDQIRFKHLFEGGLMDQRYGLDDVGLGRVDADVLEPTPEGGQVDGFCNGWRLLVDLPDPFGATGANEPAMRMYLEPISTAVVYRDDGDVYTADGAFLDDFNEDPSSADFNPIPLVASGTTPIATSLKDAYDWYVNLNSPGGFWADDPLALCRNWYVVLITDGEESCYRRADDTPWHDYACEPGQAGASAAAAGNSFADPLSTSGLPLPAVPVHVVGFSAGATTATGRPAMACVADNTGGQYYSAQNASELANTLYEVFTNMVESDRFFLAVAVSPAPLQYGGAGGGDMLVVLPRFVPRNRSSLWEGSLFAFRVDRTNPSLPVKPPGDPDEGKIDTAQAIWNAADSLAQQLQGASPARYTYWPRFSGGQWTRVPLETVPGDATLSAAFKGQLARPGGVTDTEVQEIVAFLRYVDPGARPRPFPLGDVFHSSPVIVSPPNYFPYYYRNVHDYPTFMQDNQYRRRFVLVGANDGLLHAFDAGAFDRDQVDNPGRFDLGTGRELFSVLPGGVMSRVYNLTYGTEHQYLVDGRTTSADVFVTLPGESDRQWRTLAVTALRKGGRSLLALDVTHPDPPGTSGPGMPVDASCGDGATSGCTAVYPRVAWEFTDTSDEDANCPAGLVGDQCSPYWDLGWTWSPPAIARVKRDNTASPSSPDDMFVAFFGGGWDPTHGGQTAYSPPLTGTFFYGVDVETGEVVYKQPIPGSMVPGGVASLDVDEDGFVDRLYFGDTTGGLWRLDVTAPAAFSGAPARVTSWSLTTIFQLPSEQEFFTRPSVFPALFDGSAFTFALALGAGDRANVDLMDGVENRFYVVLDMGDNLTRTEADLAPVMHDDPPVGNATSYLRPADGFYGWYLHLRANEKVNDNALVVAEKVIFPAFEPTPMQSPDPDNPVCRASGIGRLYVVAYNNADPASSGGGDERFRETGGMTSGATNLSGDSRGGGVSVDEDGDLTEEEWLFIREHVITNWRED